MKPELKPETYHEKLKRMMGEYVHLVYALARDFPKESKYLLHFALREGNTKKVLNPDARFRLQDSGSGLQTTGFKLQASRYMLLMVLLGIGFSLMPVWAFAADLYFRTPDGPRAPASAIVVRLLVTSERELNAFSIEIGYPAELLKFRSANTAGSIINFWSQRPTEAAPGKLRLEGGIMGKPFSGYEGEIATIVFEALKEGRPVIAFRNAELYYADGQGTKADTSTKDAELDIAIEAPIEVAPWTQSSDKTPPRIAFAEFIRNPADKAFLLAFQAIDDQSGIKTLAIRKRTGLRWNEWQNAASPYRVEAGTWQVQLRATDNAGNEAVKTLYVEPAVRKAVTAGTIFIGILLLWGLGIAVIRLKSRHRV